MKNLFMTEILTPPTSLPIEVDDADKMLALAVVDELQQLVLWRAIVSQERRIVIDGPLPSHFQIEPVASVVSLTRWTPSDAAEVIPADTYSHISSDPAGATIFANPGMTWPEPLRPWGSFALTYMAGWTVTPETAAGAGDAVNEVPASVRLMCERAVAFRAGAGLGDIKIGSLDLSVASSYSTDKLPSAIASIGRAYQYRPGVFSSRP